MEIDINDIIKYPAICPFNRDSFDYLYNDTAGNTLLNHAQYLYYLINYQFSSPGNSFLRNVIFEMNRPFQKQLHSSQIFEHTLADAAYKQKYDHCFNGLIQLASSYKFRVLSPGVLLQMEEAETISITSSRLTAAGISQTIHSIHNLPAHVLKKINYISINDK